MNRTKKTKTMKYLKIQNQGLLDIRLLSLMGGTTKDNDPFKIGQWGSGLKYSIAYLLKNNIDFKVFIGTREISIETVTEEISGQEFDIIYVDNEKTSLTIKMGGQDWKPWTIIRELWCNALDQGGELKTVTVDTFGEEDKTTFFIQVTPDFQKVLDNWNKYFVHDILPLFENDEFKIYPSFGKLRLFKQGVLIHESVSEKKSLFSYDIKDADINELREFRGSVDYPIFKALSKANKEVVTQFMENLTEDHYESNIDFSQMTWLTNPNNNWKECLSGVKIIHQEAVDEIKSRGIKEIDLASMLVVPKKVYEWLSKTIEGIGALRTSQAINEFFEIYDQELEMKIKQSLAILESCSYFISPELKFIYGVFGDKNIYAKVDLDSKTVYFSEQLKDKSLFDVITTIIEENEHFRTGFGDCSRPFQQHFIDLYTKTILDKNEVKI